LERLRRLLCCNAVVEEVDIPLFAFDPSEALRLVNSAAERLLQQSAPRLLGRTATELGLKTCLSAENASVIPLHFNSDARWFVRRSSFRQRGVPHTLIVLSDVSRALREEERLAWQRLIRVMGHELNNSLAPIKSIAGSLHARLSGSTLPRKSAKISNAGWASSRLAPRRSIASCKPIGNWHRCRRRPQKIDPVASGDARGRI
jgi:nitrogen fixation/metabolism regulation signal transduction histidine kinase